MPFTIITTTNARRDVQQAIDWENRRKPGLATYFLDDLNKRLEALAITPGAGSIRYKNVRVTHTKLFRTICTILLMKPCSRLLY